MDTPNTHDQHHSISSASAPIKQDAQHHLHTLVLAPSSHSSGQSAPAVASTPSSAALSSSSHASAADVHLPATASSRQSPTLTQNFSPGQNTLSHSKSDSNSSSRSASAVAKHAAASHAAKHGNKTTIVDKKRGKEARKAAAAAKKVVVIERPQPLIRNANKTRPDPERFPFAIVWAPLPFITWLVPIIGHTGVSNSKGIIYDFSDDFNVSVDNFSFGAPTKYYRFAILAGGSAEQAASIASLWDNAVEELAARYEHTRHSLFFNNCHQYISAVLNKIKYMQRTDWTQTDVWYMITFESRYTGVLGFVRQWGPFVVILMAVCVVLSLLFA